MKTPYLPLFLIFAGLVSGKQVVLTRDHPVHQVQEPVDPRLKIKFVGPGGETETIAAKSAATHRFLRQFKDWPLRKGRQQLKILVLRVEFVADDDSATTGNGKMDLVGYGSVEDGLFYDPPHTKDYFEKQMQFLSNYYKANSFGHCRVEYDVRPAASSHSYQLPHKMNYYSGFDHIEYLGGGITIAVYNTYIMEMGIVRIVADAIAAADQDTSIHFSDYDNVVVFHAGCLWQVGAGFNRFQDIPSATVPPLAFEYYLGKSYFVVDAGQDTVECAISLNSEHARVDGIILGSLGTAVHEFGHILGLPDLYDVYGYSMGVGSWDLMGYGGWAGSQSIGAPYGSLPTCLGAWPRYYLGWVDPLVYTAPESLLTLRASEIDTTQYAVAGQTMIKIPISATEYYLIENRQQDIRKKDTVVVDVENGVPVYIDDGEFDFFLPGSGILVWHIDENVIYGSDYMQTDPGHKGVDLEEADGIQHYDAYLYYDTLEFYGSKYDAFFADDSGKANHRFGPFTRPNSDSYYGKTLANIEIKSQPDTLMSLAFDYDIYLEGFPATVRPNQAIYATTWGDFDGDSDREILCLTRNGYLQVMHHDGTTGQGRFFGTFTTYPAIGDLDSDGDDDVVFGSNAGLFGLDGLTLDTLPGFPFIAGDAIVGAPLLFDINGDGRLEIIFGSMDRNLYCLNRDGASLPGFPVYLNTWVLSTPCVFDEEARKIGVLGSDGRFWLVGANGVLKEFTDSRHTLVGYSSPVTGDLDRDGEPEAVIINGNGTVYVYGADTLEEKFEILIDTTMYLTPALADIDNDGYLEIISPNSSKTLFVSNRNGTSENNFPLRAGQNLGYPLFVCDVDGEDNREEIVYGLAPADSLGSGTLELVNDRKRVSAFSHLFGEGGFSSPGVVCDLNSDGDLEIAAGSDAGILYVWDFPITKSSWTGYMNSPRNWGKFTGQLGAPPVAAALLGHSYVYPSPVSRRGRVRFYLYRTADVRIDILDVSSRKVGSVKDIRTTASEYNEVEFDFSNIANGVYIARIEAHDGDRRDVRFSKFAILK